MSYSSLGCQGEIRDPPAVAQKPSPGFPGIPPDEPPVDFAREVQPILAEYCVRCHGGVRELGNLNLQSRKGAERVLGCAGCRAEKSELYARAATTDQNRRMPLGAPPLPPDKLEVLRRWVESGAPWPTHWSYRPIAPVDPASVPVSATNWPLTPLDRFVLNRLERAGITPAEDADAPTLLRRVYLDLTGLPPTPEAVEAFAADSSPPALGAVVDQLLSSPAFGERWGRHWLDQARYADSDGYEKDSPRMTAWRYRDWVVDAFNADMPFDDFTLRQLAGDLLPSATALDRLATAFNTQTLLSNEGGVDPEEDRVKRVTDRAATIGNVWLGLSLQCAQCHGHPYDDVTQLEFYRLFAFFNQAEESRAEVPVSGRVGESEQLTASVLAERPPGVQTYLLKRGNFLAPDTQAGPLSPSTPKALHSFSPLPRAPNRLDLARWLTSKANSLTPRVIVNTIWSHLFGRGIVASLDDFGVRGELPTHPELLDWLAQDFAQNGWRQKRVIRQIVLSHSYRQSSRARPELETLDPDNHLLSRQARFRLEAEVIVDSVLAVSGLLSHKLGGPCVFPPLPEEFRSLVRGPYSDFEWTESSGEDRYRRSLYTFHKRSAAYPTLTLFDWPAASASSNGRPRSTSPLQALAALHDVTFVDAARALAQRAGTEHPNDVPRQLERAFRLALARRPHADELEELTSLHAENRALYGEQPGQAVLLLGKAASLSVDPASDAALVTASLVLLNLDEFMTRE